MYIFIRVRIKMVNLLKCKVHNIRQTLITKYTMPVLNSKFSLFNGYKIVQFSSALQKSSNNFRVMKPDLTFANATGNSSDSFLEKWQEILEVSITGRMSWLQVLFNTTLIIIFVAGVCGNLLTCVVIYYNRSMHTITNYYLFNMAVSDLLVAFGILIEFHGYNSHPFDVFGDKFCKFYFFLVAVLWNNSILTITVLAIERFIAVWHPLLLSKEYEGRRVMIIICFIWVIAIIEAVPEIFTVYLIQFRGYSMCFIVPTPFAKLLNGILGLVSFIIPLGINILMYAMVAFKVNVTQTSCNYSGNQIFNHGNSSGKVNKLIMALTVSFMVCWVPFFAMRIMIFTMDLQCPSWYMQYWELLLMLSSFNCWFSIVLNPLLFSLMSTKFRKALKALWNTKFKRPQSKRRNVPSSSSWER